MYAVDMDKDGCTGRLVAAEWAHGVGLYWYQQQKTGADCNLAFKKFQFMGDSPKDSAADVAKWGAGFTEPHALEVMDMDGDGRPDVIAGKERFAHPHGQPDPGHPDWHAVHSTSSRTSPRPIRTQAGLSRLLNVLLVDAGRRRHDRHAGSIALLRNGRRSALLRRPREHRRDHGHLRRHEGRPRRLHRTVTR